MKNFLKKFGAYLLVILVYIPAVISWIIFVPSWKLLHFCTDKFGFKSVKRWRWLGVDVEEF